jgi:hypothetical protein
MTMQTDVKSQHAAVSGLMVAQRTRLRGATIFPFSGATGYSAFVENTSIAGTYTRATTTATVTATGHGLSTGQWVYLDWDLTDNPYQVTVTTPNAFTVTVTDAGFASGNVTVYNKMLMQADASSATAFTMVIPGQGILADQGIRVFLGANIHCTIFYG